MQVIIIDQTGDALIIVFRLCNLSPLDSPDKDQSRGQPLLFNTAWPSFLVRPVTASQATAEALRKLPSAVRTPTRASRSRTTAIPLDAFQDTAAGASTRLKGKRPLFPAILRFRLFICLQKRMLSVTRCEVRDCRPSFPLCVGVFSICFFLYPYFSYFEECDPLVPWLSSKIPSLSYLILSVL
jgi:hypothetical protein